MHKRKAKTRKLVTNGRCSVRLINVLSPENLFWNILWNRCGFSYIWRFTSQSPRFFLAGEDAFGLVCFVYNYSQIYNGSSKLRDNTDVKPTMQIIQRAVCNWSDNFSTMFCRRIYINQIIGFLKICNFRWKSVSEKYKIFVFIALFVKKRTCKALWIRLYTAKKFFYWYWTVVDGKYTS